MLPGEAAIGRRPTIALQAHSNVSPHTPGVPVNLENQTALITGSSGGIGEDFAVAFAKRKVNLVLVARREDKLLSLIHI